MVDTARVLSANDSLTVEYDWGCLTWYASGGLGNSDEMTLGRCIIRPGQENPPHTHPNCEEVLHLIAGRLAHTADDQVLYLEPGDTITIPRHVRHNARNVGTTDAVMFIAFSSADRQMQAGK